MISNLTLIMSLFKATEDYCWRCAETTKTQYWWLVIDADIVAIVATNVSIYSQEKSAYI